MKIMLLILMLIPGFLSAQRLAVPARKANALTGDHFAATINDTSLGIKEREQKICSEIIAGNIPDCYRNLVEVKDTTAIDGKLHTISYFVLPDYLAVGTDNDYFFTPLTPASAQDIANKLKCVLPTRKMVDAIYRNAAIKLSPMPIQPGPQMTTVPVFIKHNEIIRQQRDSLGHILKSDALIAGDKKDVIISNRIYNDTSAFHVVIYGWHRLNAKAIQPVYAKQLNTWADYSHGIRLVQNTCWVNGKKTSIKEVLMSDKLSALLSDEGRIAKPYYPENPN